MFVYKNFLRHSWLVRFVYINREKIQIWRNYVALCKKRRKGTILQPPANSRPKPITSMHSTDYQTVEYWLLLTSMMQTNNQADVCHPNNTQGRINHGAKRAMAQGPPS